ncbi:hypothetical protein AeMF1_017141 [Aphanomyces euteiches]|nr:hypothetical protein AeMF1_017141 [Aphanomyces euteiches]KAH9192759.1 hypothetical protein AeNC1_005259 [Aphanomyces euteiches]
MRLAFRCPLSGDLMTDPVVASDGYSYDRENIEAYMVQHTTSPVTNEPLESIPLRPNHALKSAMRELEESPNSANGVHLVSFYGPITHDIMTEPVIASDGHSYDRTSILFWFRQRRTSPVTNAPLHDTTLLPNYTLKQAIDEIIDAPAPRRIRISHTTITCDGCGLHPVIGIRYKSHIVPNFDLCEDCEASGRYVTHEPFYKIRDSRLVGRPAIEIEDDEEDKVVAPVRSTPRFSIAHTSVTCDGCLEFPVRGVRYKSSVAYDFDLCSACEASGMYAFCEPFVKITDSRKISRPATIDIDPIDELKDEDDSSPVALYRVRAPVALCWTPNALDVISNQSLLEPDSLVSGFRRVRGVNGVVFVELSGLALGVNIHQVFVPEALDETYLERVLPCTEQHVLVTKRPLVKTLWPTKRPHGMIIATPQQRPSCIQGGETILTSAVLFDGTTMDHAFYRLADSNEWIYVHGDADASLVS